MLAALADVLEGMAGELGDLRDDLTELNDFVESIDEDLEDLEAAVDGDERDAGYTRMRRTITTLRTICQPEERLCPGERPARALLRGQGRARNGGVPLAGSVCTECGKVFFVPLHEIREENELYTCPHCHKPVDFTPLGPDNVPIAKPYRE